MERIHQISLFIGSMFSMFLFLHFLSFAVDNDALLVIGFLWLPLLHSLAHHRINSEATQILRMQRNIIEMYSPLFPSRLATLTRCAAPLTRK